mgnify:CR=1 FL=1
MKLFYHIFKYDPLGIKKFKYYLLDKALPPSALKKETISYYVHPKEKKYYLNLEKNKWNHPVDESEIYDLSFIELYRISIHKAIYIIDKINDVLYNKQPLNTLDEVFQNLSYLTGKPCEEKQRLQYFQF